RADTTSRFSYNYPRTSSWSRNRRAACRSSSCRRTADPTVRTVRSRHPERVTMSVASSPPLFPDLSAYCVELARPARAAGGLVATVSGGRKNAWLHRTADAREQRSADILAANEKDVAGAADLGLSAAQIDRLRLTPQRLRDAAMGMRNVADLPDP